MKRQWLAGIAFLAAVGYLMGMTWKPSRQGPRLEVSPEFHVGELIHGEERIVRVGFRNAGDQQLTVDPLALSCACAKPKLDRETGYQPGQTGWFELTLKATSSPGSVFRQMIQLDTNDGANPRQVITVAGTMQSSLTVSPAKLRVDQAVVGEPWKRSISVGRAGDEGHLQIVRLSCTIPGVELPEPDQLAVNDRGEYEIEVRHPGAAAVGEEAGKIELITNHMSVPRLLIPIEIAVSSHVKVGPPSVLFREGDQEHQFRLTAASEFDLTSTSNDDAWDIRIDRLDDSRKEYRVTLRPKTETPPEKPLRGEIPLTVAGIGPEHEVAIRYLVMPSSSSSE